MNKFLEGREIRNFDPFLSESSRAGEGRGASARFCVFPRSQWKKEGGGFAEARERERASLSFSLSLLRNHE